VALVRLHGRISPHGLLEGYIAWCVVMSLLDRIEFIYVVVDTPFIYSKYSRMETYRPRVSTIIAGHKRSTGQVSRSRHHHRRYNVQAGTARAFAAACRTSSCVPINWSRPRTSGRGGHFSYVHGRRNKVAHAYMHNAGRPVYLSLSIHHAQSLASPKFFLEGSLA
jgi:hypothetical protein